ncbi:hypothetical protein GCM10010358_64500 [Streptomyces minutiscleroticus]|uniref:Uncharacterized protein n=1 Tax=Streptomyces minutiscleroticus TaxID=68238 RepID=A0A918U749_9ACTN|nr:hypothetical protein GCM10010358_64500 [Streptomyces minutiscleroticus]
MVETTDAVLASAWRRVSCLDTRGTRHVGEERAPGHASGLRPLLLEERPEAAVLPWSPARPPPGAGHCRGGAGGGGFCPSACPCSGAGAGGTGGAAGYGW